MTVDASASGEETPLDIADTYYGTHFGDLIGWVQGQYPTGDRAPMQPLESRPNSIEAGEDEKGRLGRIYVTYTKFNEKTGLIYSGRTSMIIDLSKDYLLQAALAVAMRDKNHHVEDQEAEPKDDGFREALPDEFDVGKAVDYGRRYEDIAYRRVRGREQQLIDFHGRAQADTGKPYRTHNKVRGVAKDNKYGRQFHKEATDYWGEELHPYTGF